jgi:XTP/dITP diphosphohydrolase
MERERSRLVLATANAGKLSEMRRLLGELGLEIVSQGELGIEPAEETGLSFVENALLKARHASAFSGLPAIADDSGLAVDTLGGQPGIYSSRYAGSPGSDQDNVQLLLENLRGLELPDRRARFHCAAVWVAHAKDPVPLICEGVWEGTIALQPRGRGGFGYDPVFLLPDGRTAAELQPDEKNRMSHRGQAMDCLRRTLATRMVPASGP